jgi:hypothetical protein
MSIQVKWDDARNDVIRLIFEEGWSLQAYYHSIAALDVMMRSSVNPITVIMDMTHTTTTPIMRVPRGRTVNENQILCDASRLILVNARYFSPQLTCPVERVDTLEQAYQRIEETIMLGA